MTFSFSKALRPPPPCLAPQRVGFHPVSPTLLRETGGCRDSDRSHPGRTGHGAAQPAGQSKPSLFNPAEDVGGVWGEWVPRSVILSNYTFCIFYFRDEPIAELSPGSTIPGLISLGEPGWKPA